MSDSLTNTTQLIQCAITINTFDVKTLRSLSDEGILLHTTIMNDFMPRVMLGRQKGHSTAIMNFAKINPDLKIGVVVPTIWSFDQYKKHDNLYCIIKMDSDFSRGINFDYIIIDSVGYSFKMSKTSFKELLGLPSHTRIIGVGN